MSYFNHSFTKRFLSNGITFKAGDPVPGTNFTSKVDVSAGLITSIDPDFTTADLAKYPPGYIGLFNAKTYKLYDPKAPGSGYSNNDCCPFIVASSSLYANDKIGPFHGGYRETNKSKVVNPKYIEKVWGVSSCLPEQAVLHIGQTNINGVGRIDLIVNFSLSTLPPVDGVYTGIPSGSGYGAIFQATTVAGDIVDLIILNPGLGYINDSETITFVDSDGNNFDVNIEFTATTEGAGKDCCPTFCCEKDYYLRIDVKGSPALRFANHNLYRNLLAEGGTCCDSLGGSGDSQLFAGLACPSLKDAICDVCTPVDPTLIYLQWAKGIVNDPYLKDFINPVVFDWTGAAWYAPGTNNGVQEWAKVNPDGTVTDLYKLSPAAVYWTEDCSINGSVITVFSSSLLPGGNGLYPSGFSSEAEWVDFLQDNGIDTNVLTYAKGCCSGLRLEGAYVDTKFGNCSFQITDFFEKEPVKLYASLVDIEGNECFNQICIVNECLGKQGIGFGEQVLRDLILSESYLQNFFATDIRIREITQGNDILNAVDRNALYERIYIQHSVPRFNNPTGVFDNDRYLLEIIAPTNGFAKGFIEAYQLAFDCYNCPDVELYGCSSCNTIPVPRVNLKS